MNRMVKVENQYVCPYCELGRPLQTGKTNDIGIAIKYPAYLSAYGYDVHGGGSNGIQVKIYHCPMCGRYLEEGMKK